MPEFSYTPPEVTSIVGLIETYLRWREMNGPDRGYEVYHPSAMGKCLRMMQYQRYEARGLIKGNHEGFPGKMLRLFENGHSMHERWKNYFEHLGVLRGVWACRNPLCRLFHDEGMDMAPHATVGEIRKNPEKFLPRVYGEDDLQGVFKPERCVCGFSDFRYDEVLVEDKELNFRGHADIILDFSRFDGTLFDESVKDGLAKFFNARDLPKGIVVVDMKSCGKNSYMNQVQKMGPHKYYQIQLTVYVNVLKCDFGLLWYEEKDQFDTSVFKIEANPGAWEQIRKQALTMQEMANAAKPLLPPPRPISKSSYECKGCAFSKFCHKAGGIWDDPQLEQKRKEFYGDLL
jgi:hypothetical protein